MIIMCILAPLAWHFYSFVCTNYKRDHSLYNINYGDLLIFMRQHHLDNGIKRERAKITSLPAYEYIIYMQLIPGDFAIYFSYL